LPESIHQEFLDMHAHAVVLALAPTGVEVHPNPDPMQAYRAYLGAVARREFAAVVAGMTEACARQLHGLRQTPDFQALFELWCDSQRDPVVVTHCAVAHDVAIIDVRSRHTVGRVTLHLANGAWRIDSELHRPLRGSAAS
jgi:hypothetical protein